MPNQSNLDNLIDKIRQLRDKKNGCPWMLQQTLASIVPHTLEEAYEVADAVENKKMNELKYELGDLLYSILIYADFAHEQGDFNFDDIIEGLDEKITRRHPHLFDEDHLQKNPSLAELEKNWIEIKKQESEQKTKTSDSNSMNSVLSNIPLNLPALSYAQKIQKQAASQGFDWEKTTDIIDKLQEEVLEYQEALVHNHPNKIQEELGDVLFTVVNLIRHNGFDSEQTLRLASHKFTKRFQQLEAHIHSLGKELYTCSIDELDLLWNKIKNQ